jgi:hypothetical protein
MFLDSRQGDKMFCNEWYRALPEFSLLLISSWIRFWFVIVVPKYLNCALPSQPDNIKQMANLQKTLLSPFPFWVHFPKLGLCDLHGVSVSVNLSIYFCMAEPIFMKLGICVIAPEPISTAYFINPSYQSACLYVYHSYRCQAKAQQNVAHLSLLRNGLAKTLPQQRIHMQQ